MLKPFIFSLNAAKHAAETEVDPFGAIEPYIDVQQAQKETIRAESNAKAVTAKSKKRFVPYKNLRVQNKYLYFTLFLPQFQVKSAR